MSIGVLDVVDRLPLELQARLETDAFFEDIPVVVADEGDIEAEIARKRALVRKKGGKWGAAVVVLPLIGDDIYPDVTFGPLRLHPAFQVLELVDQNRGKTGTGKSARRIARRILNDIKSLCLYGLTTEFVPERPYMHPVDVETELGKLVRAYQCDFATFESDTEEIIQVAMPHYAQAEGETPAFQILCETEGAEIWYNLDDGFPGPGRPGSQVYAAPIEIPEAGLVARAAAYKAGAIGSQVIRATITSTLIS